MQPRHTLLMCRAALFGVLLAMAGLTSVTVASDGNGDAQSTLVKETRTGDSAGLEV